MGTPGCTSWWDAYCYIINWLQWVTYGIEEPLSTAFKGVHHMINLKAWPKAFCGLRMVVEAVLEPFVLAGNVTVSSLEQLFDDTRQSRTASGLIV